MGRLSPAASPHHESSESDCDSNRKRAPRALTGKHVRQGMGASPNILMTLRQKIKQKQRLKEMNAKKYKV